MTWGAVSFSADNSSWPLAALLHSGPLAIVSTGRYCATVPHLDLWLGNRSAVKQPRATLGCVTLREERRAAVMSDSTDG